MENREGYCSWCKHVDGLSERVAEGEKPSSDNKCNGCWFTDDKPNWEYHLKGDDNV